MHLHIQMYYLYGFHHMNTKILLNSISTIPVKKENKWHVYI